jgi:hypothetical protein
MTTTLNTDELARLGVAKNTVRRQRQNKVLLAKLLRERNEAPEEDADEGEEGTGGETEDRNIVRLLIGSRMLRRRRLRNLLLAHLLREKGEAEDEGEEYDEGAGEEGEEDDRGIVKLLVASRMLRRRRFRKLVLAHLLREKDAAEEDEEDVGDEESGDEDDKLVRVLIGSRILRRRRARKLLLAHLLRERGEGAEDEDFEEDEELDEAGGDDRRVMKLLVGSRILRRKRARRLLLTHLLRQQKEEVA